MFNREESSKYKKIKLRKNEYKRIGTIFLTITLVNFLNGLSLEQSSDNFESMKDHTISAGIDFEYINNVQNKRYTQNYDGVIVSFYNNGEIEFSNRRYSIEKFYLVYGYNSDKFEVHLVCTPLGLIDIFTNEKIAIPNYQIIRFRETSVFAILLQRNLLTIDNNCIILNKNFEEIIEVIKSWNGMLHSLVPETDAYENKQVFSQGENGYDKSR